MRTELSSSSLAEPPAARMIPGPYPQEEMDRFLRTYLYEPGAVFVDRILRMDHEKHEIVAEMDTTRPLAFTALQRTNDTNHPPHVSGPELVLLAGNLGCLHAYFFHGCRWDEGWVGFGNRIYRADFKRLAMIGPPLRLESVETRSRVGPERILLRYEFRFSQEGNLVYFGDHAGRFFKGNLAE